MPIILWIGGKVNKKTPLGDISPNGA